MALKRNTIKRLREDIRLIGLRWNQRHAHKPGGAQLTHLEVLALNMPGVGSGPLAVAEVIRSLIVRLHLYGWVKPAVALESRECLMAQLVRMCLAQQADEREQAAVVPLNRPPRPR